jgi:hypothetical protein
MCIPERRKGTTNRGYLGDSDVASRRMKGNLTAARLAGSPGIFRVASDAARVRRLVRAGALQTVSGGIPALWIPKITGAYNELAPLAKDQVFTLQLGKVLGDSGSRRAHQAGKVLMAESDS